MPSPLAPDITSPLAIVCGAGDFPLAVADAIATSGRPVFLIGIEGSASPEIARHPHAWSRLGRAGRILGLAHKAGAREIALVGAVRRPSSPLDVLPDLRGFRLLLRILGRGDNHMLSTIAQDLAREGLTVRGVHEIAPGLILPAGTLGHRGPSEEAIRAAELGFDVLAALSPYDIGQAVIVADRRVVAIEAAEGTDLMLERVADLRASSRLKLPRGTSVLVKAAKHGQDLRLDTPAIGPRTVDRAAAAGLSGIAIAAGQVMTPDTGTLIAAADAAGIFVLGLKRP